MERVENLRPLTSLRFVETKVSEWWILLLPVSLWIWLCHDWPARLGFYSDDWTVFLHPFVGTSEAFTDIFYLVISRPVSVPYIWLAQVIVDWSPVRSQVLSALMLLTTAASVGLLASSLIRISRLRDGAIAAACLAAASFIVFPSTFGTFAWGTGASAAVPALPLFCLGMSLLLHSEGSRVGLGLILVLLSHLSYEAFYFQEITLILLATALSGRKIKDIPLRVLAAAVIVNVGCLTYNHLVVGGIHKPFNPDFLRTFTGSYSQIVYVFYHATREHGILVGASVLGTALFGSICLAGIVGFARMLTAGFVVICGVVAAAFLYAFAGYGLNVEGISARVSIVTAIYAAVTVGVLAAGAWCKIGRDRVPAVVFLVCAVIELPALCLTARHRVDEWADTWTYETERLSRLPAEVFSGDKQRIYLAIEDRAPSAVEPASEIWEIGGAVAWTAYNKTGNRRLMLDIWHGEPPRWFTSHSDWFNRWDGSKFEQGPCTSMAPTYSVQGAELWAWRTSTNELVRIEAPWEHGCQSYQR
jgi:hypothetical protein